MKPLAGLIKVSIVNIIALAAITNSAIAEKISVLYVDGQNNHAVWPKGTIMMKQYLEETGLFTVDVQRTRFTSRAGREQAWLKYVGIKTEDHPKAKSDSEFAPDFSGYDVVVSNFGWGAAPWPEKTQKAFEKFVKNGGGFVSVHAADNSFPEWKAYNRMIGIGGWGNRNEKDGPYVYYNDDGKLIRDTSKGRGGAHGKRHEFPITVRNSNHPITKGLPKHWLTSEDECYGRLRGPAEQMTVLATGEDLSKPELKGRHEPMLMTIKFGKGRVFHNTLGHDTAALEGVSFITTFTRGTEWAATGKVTQTVPDDFPKKDKATSRKFDYKK